jgi:hypothetical protein
MSPSSERIVLGLALLYLAFPTVFCCCCFCCLFRIDTGLENRDYVRGGSASLPMRHPYIRSFQLTVIFPKEI